ncbi:MAG: hypothetical protein KGH72_05975, partial [Candidatus Micrarchaeota archaeon]|nr:hypothetical protein [Candidatus Micrarchaeota archaeon]
LAVPDASVSKKLERLLDGLSSQRIVAIINTIGNDPRTQDDAAVVANAICEAARVGGAPAAEKLGNLLLMVKNDTHLLNVMCSHDSAVFLAAAIGEDLAAERMAHSAMRG